MSCERHYGIAGYPDCSGRGTCVDGFCICDAGWSSIGDLELIEGYDCDIHIPTIRIAAIACIIMQLPALIFVIRPLFYLKEFYSTKTACMVAVFVLNITGNVYMICKVVDPIYYTLGRSYFLAVNQALLGTGAFTIAASFTLLILKFLKGYIKMLRINERENLKSFENSLRRAMIAAPLTIFWAMFVPMIISINDPSLSDSMNQISAILLCFFHFMILACLGGIVSMFMKEIKAAQRTSPSISSGDINNNTVPTNSNLQDNKNRTESELENLLNRADKIYKTVLPTIFNGALMYAVNAAWRFYRRKLTYQIMLQMLTMNLVAPFFVLALHRVTKKYATIVEKYKDKGTQSVNPTLSLLRANSMAPADTAKQDESQKYLRWLFLARSYIPEFGSRIYPSNSVVNTKTIEVREV